jgi:integrase
MANKGGHRRFGNVRKRESGRYQIRYPGPDGLMRTGPETYDRKTDADRALVLIEAQIASGEWTDPERGKTKLGDYAATWIVQRPGLRVRTVDLYNWLLAKHITPYLGGVPIGKLSTPMIRKWRADLLDKGVSVSMAAKAYRLLRAILTTAVEEDKILARNPCRVRGAGEEHAPERPVLTVAEVFDLAERVGRRPVGNVRLLSGGGYRLRFRRDGRMRTAPEVYDSRPAAERALWDMADGGRADFSHDGRFRAMVLLTTFASLRWGEVTALTRSDLDLKAGTVRVRAAFTQRRSNGSAVVLGPPKSRAGRRIVGIPKSIIPALEQHLAKFVGPEPGALVFCGPSGAPIRRSNFGKMSGWPYAVRSIGAEGLHFHDLRQTGNTFAAAGGTGIKDLMARMGHDSERAALIYQHQARGADKLITNAIDAHVEAERKRTEDDGDDGTAGALVPVG